MSALCQKRTFTGSEVVAGFILLLGTLSQMLPDDFHHPIG